MDRHSSHSKIARDASDLAFRIGQALERKVIERAASNVAASAAAREVVVKSEDVLAAFDQILLDDVQREMKVAAHGSGRERRLSA